jgi:hypothetical protein
MTLHDDRVRLLHMLDYSRKAALMIQGRTRIEGVIDQIQS